MDRALLEKPFPAELVKTRKGAHGDLSYVEGIHYIRRLNEAFNGEWSWKILGQETKENEVIVRGELQAAGVVRQAFGTSGITVNRSTGEVISVGDDIKAAATDALKKACSLLGIGLDLYGPAPAAEARQTRPVPAPRPVAAPAPAQPQQQPRQEQGNGQVTQIDRNRLTAKQLKAIYAIGQAQGVAANDLKARSREIFGVVPEFLSRKDASSFIDQLKAA